MTQFGQEAARHQYASTAATAAHMYAPPPETAYDPLVAAAAAAVPVPPDVEPPEPPGSDSSELPQQPSPAARAPKLAVGTKVWRLPAAGES